MSMSMVVLPDPDGPTTARVSPCPPQVDPAQDVDRPEPAVSVK
jgi:hypothetical protein